MISKICRVASQERSSVAVFYILAKVFDQVRGRLLTIMLGWPKSYLGKGSKVLGTNAILVGKNAYINRYAWIDAVHHFGKQRFAPTIQIGCGFSAADRLHISSINRIEIGENCLFGSGVYISDHNHGAYKGLIQSNPSEPPVKRALVSFGPVEIGSNVWLGDNVVIIGPVKIGDGVVVGANSVITKDIPCNVIAVGIQQRLLKRFNDATGLWESENLKA